MQKNVIEYLWKTVERVPNKVAIDDNKEQVTFAQLQQSAIKVAACIREVGLRKCPVGIYVPKSAKMVQAFAGVSLSCNFYVPLDTKSPDARIQSILQVLGAKVVITTSALKANWSPAKRCAPRKRRCRRWWTRWPPTRRAGKTIRASVTSAIPPASTTPDTSPI